MTPVVKRVSVIPVAGRDSMLLNLSGAHGPYFTRNLLLLEDSDGRLGIGEVPGGEKIRQTLEEAKPLIEGASVAAYKQVMLRMHAAFSDRDSARATADTLRNPASRTRSAPAAAANARVPLEVVMTRFRPATRSAV